MPVHRERAATMRASFSLSAARVARPVDVCPIISVPSVLQEKGAEKRKSAPELKVTLMGAKAKEVEGKAGDRGKIP